MGKIIYIDDTSESTQYLCKVDKRFARVYSLIGPITYQVHEGGYAFVNYEIVEQMLSKKVGTIIYNRLLDICSGNVSPEVIASLSDEQIRSIGTSSKKVEYIRSLTDAVLYGRLVFDSFGDLSDANVIKQLTSVKGIGRWTAKMYLIFCLNRPDVIPYEDVAFLQGFAWAYNTNIIDKSSVENTCKQWSPYASIASRYMYRALDGGYTNSML